jgi:hypothetical protein
MKRQSAVRGRLGVSWVDPRRIMPIHEIRRMHHFRELVARMLKYGWQGRPLAVESLGEGRIRLRPSGHYMGWTGTHRMAAAGVVASMKPGFKVPVIIINSGRPSRRPLLYRTTTDASRYKMLRGRRDAAAALLLAELRINRVADKAGVL